MSNAGSDACLPPNLRLNDFKMLKRMNKNTNKHMYVCMYVLVYVRIYIYTHTTKYLNNNTIKSDGDYAHNIFIND